jgi:hypothetical protein
MTGELVFEMDLAQCPQEPQADPRLPRAADASVTYTRRATHQAAANTMIDAMTFWITTEPET